MYQLLKINSILIKQTPQEAKTPLATAIFDGNLDTKNDQASSRTLQQRQKAYHWDHSTYGKRS